MQIYTDIFETQFDLKISQLIKKSKIHPDLQLFATKAHKLVDKDVIPYEVKQVERPYDRLKKDPVVIAGALRLRNDPWDMARNPATNELEYIIAYHDEPILRLTCPNCKTTNKGLISWESKITIWKTYTTEKHAILYCPYCQKFSWKKPIKDLHF